MKFYLNNVEVQVQVAPVITETLDETLDSASVVLKANNQKLPYAPMQSFRIETDNESLNFVVASDSVEIYSLDPILYKHTLSLVQNTRTLSKHLVRNSSFTQPAKAKHCYWATTSTGTTTTLTSITGCGGSHYSENLDSREKVKDTYILLELLADTLQAGTTNYTFSKFNSIDDIKETYDSAYKLNNIWLNYRLEGVQYSYLLKAEDVGGEFVFNKKLKCDKIKQYLNSGATDLYISATNGFVGINGTATNFIHHTNSRATIYVKTYYYTAYDILDLLIKRQKRKSSTREDVALFSLPQANTDLYNLLTSTIAPNFTFTQCTMYECVAEIFRLYDAIFTMDQNGVLGIEYFNDNDRQTVLSTANKMAGMNISISEDRYTNQLVAYYQDARTTRAFPNTNGFCKIRSTGVGVPTENDFNIIVDKPIYDIEKVELKLNSIGYGQQLTILTTYLGDLTIDITDYVKETSIYSLLSLQEGSPINNYVDSSSFIQNASIHFDRGNSVIPLGDEMKRGITTFPNIQVLIHSAARRFMGMSDKTSFANLYGGVFEVNGKAQNQVPTWTDLQFRITYQTTIDGRVATETIETKANGQTLINQTNGAVDLNKLGLNMEGLSLKTGIPTLNATMQLSSFSNRLKKGVIYKDSENNKWVVNSATYTIFDNDKIQAQISFVKNFNALSQRVRLLQEKRLSNVASELTQKSEDNIFDYVYFSGDSISDNGANVYLGFDNVEYMTYYTFYKELDYTNLNCAITTTYDGDTAINHCFIPLVIYGCGNSICYEMSYDNTISAGNKTTVESGWLGTNKYYTSIVKYTTDSGFFDKVSIAFRDSGLFSQNYPQATQPVSYDITNLEIYKQPNEIFALNYQLCFLPKDKDLDFVGQQFINRNYFINGYDPIKFYIYYSTTDKYSVLDTKGLGERKSITNAIIEDEVANSGFSIKFSHESLPTSNSFAICDEDGNIYFAFNRTTSGTTTKVYFKTRNSRI